MSYFLPPSVDLRLSRTNGVRLQNVHHERHSSRHTQTPIDLHRPNLGGRHPRNLDVSSRRLPLFNPAHPISSVVEANLVIICSCFLAVKSFLRHHAPTLIGEKSSSDGYKVTSAYEDRHRAPRGLVITKDVDFNLSWQDDSRVRIHEYSTTDAGGNGTVDARAGAVVKLDVIVTQPGAGGVGGGGKETRRSIGGDGTLVIQEEASAAQIPPQTSAGVQSVVTPISPR